MQVAFFGGGSRGIAHIAADAERTLAGAREDDDPDGLVVGRGFECDAQLLDGLNAKRVQTVGPVDRDRRPSA